MVRDRIHEKQWCINIYLFCLDFSDIFVSIEKYWWLWTFARVSCVFSQPRKYIWYKVEQRRRREERGFSLNKKFEIAPYLKPQCYTKLQGFKNKSLLQIEFWTYSQIYSTGKMQENATDHIWLLLMCLTFAGKNCTFWITGKNSINTARYNIHLVLAHYFI